MPLRDVKLDDKYDLGQRHVFVTGFQALVRLCLTQKELDRRNGLNTAGFVTGYRGSPLGGLDSQFLRARPFLEKATSASKAASTRTSPPPQFGVRNRPSCAARASMTAFLPCGTAKGRASIAPATCSVTPIRPVPPDMAASWR